MYSLFGGGFTVEFALFPIAQKGVLSVGFSSFLHSASTFISPVPWYPDAWGKQRNGARERGWTKTAAGTCLTVMHFHWRSPGGFPAPG